ncbi:hypothetical protein PAXRUDRAFT_22089 [Paxillus rubicundulus Ve08.2h10]|uniref:Uncharacterized protein n=1 Tax=Paxillus rubicundulus Ve08.2h10 TaxID=930991 RepID=A0A0D0CNN0_9AGAM|nr:hypothetical protein PAXRUDRAFT_22089 [Paxillus rubicundulus Ve08.2h10]
MLRRRQKCGGTEGGEAEKRRSGEAEERSAEKADLVRTVLDAEGDSITVNAAVEKLAQVAITCTGLKIRIPARQPAPQLVAIKDEVSKSISKLKGHNRIFGEPLTLNQFLEPSDEKRLVGTQSSLRVQKEMKQ